MSFHSCHRWLEYKLKIIPVTWRRTIPNFSYMLKIFISGRHGKFDHAQSHIYDRREKDREFDLQRLNDAYARLTSIKENKMGTECDLTFDYFLFFVFYESVGKKKSTLHLRLLSVTSATIIYIYIFLLFNMSEIGSYN